MGDSYPGRMPASSPPTLHFHAVLLKAARVSLRGAKCAGAEVSAPTSSAAATVP